MCKLLLLALVLFIYDEEYELSWLYQHVITKEKNLKEKGKSSMNSRTIYKKLTQWNYIELVKMIHRLVRTEPVDFNFEDILNMIYDTYEQTKDDNLAYLYVDIAKNGFLIKPIKVQKKETFCA